MKKLAFTLIELLVTIVLFSLLLATSLYSFRFVSLNIRNINNTNPQNAIYYDLLRNSIGSMYHYVSMDKKFNGDQQYYHYFRGMKTECFFVTESAFYSKRMVIVHLQFKGGELLYEEGDIFDKNVNYLDLDNIPFKRQKVLLKELKTLRFTYLEADIEKVNLERNLPQVIKVETQDSKGTQVYIFKIKSDNNKHLTHVKFGKEVL